MKERPILFSAPMVRAILEGRKTQTRRVITLKSSILRAGPTATYRMMPEGDALLERWPIQDRMMNNFGRCERVKCPYGVPGDRLWVKENWIPVHFGSYEPIERGEHIPHYPDSIQYAADTIHGYHTCWDTYPGKWRSSLSLARWMSRITLEITDVRVQRIQDISEEDARAEGIHQVLEPNTFELEEPYKSTIHKRRFSHVWDFINAKRGYGWDVNPWCWCISFKPAEV